MRCAGRVIWPVSGAGQAALLFPLPMGVGRAGESRAGIK